MRRSTESCSSWNSGNAKWRQEEQSEIEKLLIEKEMIILNVAVLQQGLLNQ